jgi:hypothetical protein
MSNHDNVDFALLAPVPLEHLESGCEVARLKGHVSFQSQKWELFREVDRLRKDSVVPVLIYPSHESVEVEISYLIKWVGWYMRHVEDQAAKRREENEGFRPPTTQKYPQDRVVHNAVFWCVTGLQALAKGGGVPIRDLESYKTGYWRKDSPPRGPEIVRRPAWI